MEKNIYRLSVSHYFHIRSKNNMFQPSLLSSFNNPSPTATVPASLPKTIPPVYFPIGAPRPLASPITATRPQSFMTKKQTALKSILPIFPSDRKKKCFVEKAMLHPEFKCTSCGDCSMSVAEIKASLDLDNSGRVQCQKCPTKGTAYMSVTYTGGKNMQMSSKVEVYSRAQLVDYFKNKYADKTRSQMQKCFEADALLCFNCILHFHEKDKPEQFLETCKKVLIDVKKRPTNQNNKVVVKKQKQSTVSLLPADLTRFSSKELKIAICELKLEVAKRM